MLTAIQNGYNIFFAIFVYLRMLNYRIAFILMPKTGSLDLPLHPGRCPPWLFSRMKNLAANKEAAESACSQNLARI